MIEATLCLDCDSKELFDLFQAEKKGAKTERASYSVKKKDDRLYFSIKAKDLPRFKSYFNAIITNIEIYYKSKEIAKIK